MGYNWSPSARLERSYRTATTTSVFICNDGVGVRALLRHQRNQILNIVSVSATWLEGTPRVRRRAGGGPMSNRHDRRKTAATERKSLRLLKLRCSGCDRVGLKMTKEHFFPRWLIDHAEVHHDGIWWIDDDEKKIDPAKATIPLCRTCNDAFGNSLESSVSAIFRQLEQGAAISEDDAELLVRWLWKFEGLQWAATTNSPSALYSRRYTLRERVTTSQVFEEVRNEMMLGVALIRNNDPGRKDWPMGLDTPVGENALTMSGVFGRSP